MVKREWVSALSVQRFSLCGCNNATTEPGPSPNRKKHLSARQSRRLTAGGRAVLHRARLVVHNLGAERATTTRIANG